MILLLSFLVTACGSDAREIPPGVHPFDGIDAELPREDLAPLWDLIGDARLIGLGESLHTSGGFYAAKERIIRALVEDHGVRLVAMETPRSMARPLGDYVVSGDCDRPAEEVLLPIAKVFSDDNTYGLMRWICERNAATPSDPVRFFGFDVKQGHLDYPEMRDFLETWAPDEAPDLLARIDTCHSEISDPPLSEPAYEACLAGLDGLQSWLASREEDLIAAAGERAVRLFWIASRSFLAWQDYGTFYDTEPDRSSEARDLGMGEVFAALLELEEPGARAAIWAHNFHLTKDHRRVRGLYRDGGFSFGTVVADTFGSEYAPVALTAHKPGINWPEIAYDEAYDLGAEEGSVEVRLHELEEPFLIVDPRAAFLEPDAEQVLSSEWMVPSEQFAAIVYIDRSPPMDAVYW